jgi:uncharacterized protein (DUF305 family)
MRSRDALLIRDSTKSPSRQSPNKEQQPMHTTTLRRAATTAAAFVLALGGLTACSDDSNEDPGADHNDADVRFATDMIPHHEQAVRMAEMAQGMDLDPAVQDLAAVIRSAQQPEIDTMASWLEDWGEDVPDSSMDGMGHSDMDDGDDAHGMPGMMSDHELQELDDATGMAFQTMWLRMMIEHHEGAIEMAKTEQQYGKYGPAKDLAEQIESTQTAEIAKMRRLIENR